MRSSPHLAWLAAAVLAWPASARAGDSIALDRFDPAPAGDRLFGVASPYVAGHLLPHAMLLSDYAHNPLVLRSVTSDRSAGALVASQLIFHANVSLGLFHRINVNLDVPFALLQTGDSPTAGGVAYTSPGGMHVADLRIGLRYRFFGEHHDAFHVALGGYLWLPLGSSNRPAGAFVSDGKVRGRPELILGGHLDRLVWSLAMGPELRANQELATIDQGSMMRAAAGFGLRLLAERRLQIGPELSVAVSLKQPSRRTTNAEVLLGTRYRVSRGLEVGAAAGPGLSAGIGTPDLRAVVTVAYTPEQRPPPPDRDEDGIADRFDACPSEPGARSVDFAVNGCPEPRRARRALVERAPSPPASPVTDAVEDDSAGLASTLETVVVKREILFELGQATIDPSNASILDDLAAALKADSSILDVEVQGHTDQVGSSYTNAVLSRARADAVKRALVARGVEMHRLHTHGYGHKVPRAQNRTEEGRRRNRRVELRVVAEKPKDVEEARP